MMNGGYMGYFGKGGYNSMQRGFNSFDKMANGSPLLTVLIVALIVVALYLVFKKKKQQTTVSALNTRNSTVTEAEEIAKSRYARGEITDEEFQTILKTLKL
ncbi:putative membrane protein [Carnobacterium alterfunditum]|uniref:Putative membrane protein n=1 Tax=Carnobacterium alterfunditum TaxID=28230 RepID=A0A1N6EXK2_9LACT|nr:SHOCT domain-containing protein [Carnobacterium alterfunditum]SIN87832.1 putative membrane protein [Carnobacterium alterfunditum]